MQYQQERRVLLLVTRVLHQKLGEIKQKGHSRQRELVQVAEGRGESVGATCWKVFDNLKSSHDVRPRGQTWLWGKGEFEHLS